MTFIIFAIGTIFGIAISSIIITMINLWEN